MDRKEAEEKVKEVKKIVARDGMTISDACREVGIKVHQYYHIAHPRKTNTKAKRKYVRKVKPDTLDNQRPVEFKEIVIPHSNDNRTLIIITSDPSTVAGVVEAFRR